MAAAPSPQHVAAHLPAQVVIPSDSIAPGSPALPSASEIAWADASMAEVQALQAGGRLHEALAILNDPVLSRLRPDDCASDRWHCYMLLGDLANAWRQSDDLRHRDVPDPHRFWDGQPVEGKRVMLRCLHGLGDAIQFLRYAPRLAARASHLILEVPPPLLDLAPFFAGPHQVMTWGDAAPPAQPAWDTQIELMELPFLFRSTLADIPRHDASFRLPGQVAPDALTPVRQPRVGLAWTGGTWNPSRSIPFSLLAPLLALSPQISFFSLQPSSTNADWSAATGRYGLPRATPDLDGLLPLAHFIAGLDLVITVDTLAAHLAGALNRPSWILLQHQADWRWLLDRSDSPWYPSVRLFRQTNPGDWSGLIGRVRLDLLAWTALHPTSETLHAPLG